VIASFQHKGLEKLYHGNKKLIEASLRTKAENILFVLDAAAKVEDVNLPGFRLHELTGNRKGTWSIAVNKNWRITFRFESGNALDVNLEDYH